ncbi:MAG: helix-turn-helix domain-containing protein [Nitrospinota bacterium]
MRVFGLPRSLLHAGGCGALELSGEARDRLRALSLWRESEDVKLVCRTFQVSRATLYRWRARFDPKDLTTLQTRSRRPRRVRRPTWSPELVQAVLRLREQYARWGKVKLVVLLGREGIAPSVSTVGRFLSHLKSRGRLVEPKVNGVSAKRRRLSRPYATRKPKDYQPRRPGDLVQVDTLDLSPLAGVTLKQFTARDVVCRWDVMEIFSRAQRTHTEEFYEVHKLPWTVASLNAHLRKWEHIYNHVRPHQALDYLTPAQALVKPKTTAPVSHIS